jgi:hypothetical protein
MEEPGIYTRHCIALMASLNESFPVVFLMLLVEVLLLVFCLVQWHYHLDTIQAAESVRLAGERRNVN